MEMRHERVSSLKGVVLLCECSNQIIILMPLDPLHHGSRLRAECINQGPATIRPLWRPKMQESEQAGS